MTIFWILNMIRSILIAFIYHPLHYHYFFYFQQSKFHLFWDILIFSSLYPPQISQLTCFSADAICFTFSSSSVIYHQRVGRYKILLAAFMNPYIHNFPENMIRIFLSLFYISTLQLSIFLIHILASLGATATKLTLKLNLFFAIGPVAVYLPSAAWQDQEQKHTSLDWHTHKKMVWVPSLSFQLTTTFILNKVQAAGTDFKTKLSKKLN